MVAALALLGGGYVWLRQSSLVAVRQVTVAGLDGSQSGQIRSVLRSAARSMTTLDVQTGRLHSAVVPYPEVKSLRVSTRFPHGMRIDVVEQVPVAVISAAGRRIAVSGDGTLLRGLPPSAALPSIPVGVAPAGDHVTGGVGEDVALLAAAPSALLPKVATVSSQAGQGLVATLRNGPRIDFGAPSQLAAKWSAATAVLASSTSAGAGYIDVTVPARPAAGTGSSAGSIASGTGASAAPAASSTAGG